MEREFLNRLSWKRTNFSFRGLFSFWPAVLLIIIFAILAIYNSFLCDDAFITFRFSQNLASGLGPVYNPGERVEGYTNFLWMILMAIAVKLGGAPQIWSRILAICFSLGTILIFLKSAYHENNSHLRNYLLAAFLILSAPFFIWSTGGLETAAFAFFLFTAVVLYLKAGETENRRSLIFASVMFAITALTRPEGVLAFGLAFGHIVVLSLIRKGFIRRIVSFLAPFAIIYGVYFIWRLGYYGKFFPNTFYIKEPASILIGLGWEYIRRFMINCPVWLPLILAIVVALRAKRFKFESGDYYIILLFLAYSIYVIFAGGDFMDLSRLLMPLLAPLFLLLNRLYGMGENILSGRISRFISLAALIIYAAANINSSIKTREVLYEYNIDSIGALRRYVTEWTSVGRLISENSQSTDTIAVTAAGIIPFYCKLYTIDMYGLEAADLSKYGKLKEFTRPGHRLTISLQYLYDLRPHFLIAHPIITEGQPRFFPATMPQNIQPILLKEYTAISMELPGLTGDYLNFWVRNDVVERISHSYKKYKIDY